MRTFLITVVIAGAFVTGASAIESTIYPGVGIGKIKLGMTKAQVERFLGKDPLLNAREGAYTEFAWDFATWTVGFRRGRAVQISNGLRNQRTKLGIGVGSSWQAVMRAYPGGACGMNINNPQTAMWPEYLVGHRGGSQTMYVFTTLDPTVPVVVREVIVRTTFRPLPEFASTWGIHCTGDWRHAQRPEPKSG